MATLLNQGRMTAEGIQALRDKIGQPLRPRTIYNRSSAYDSVNHFCIGIGDDNPLWVDEDYGKGTALGVNLAPPSYFYSLSMTVVQLGLPGVHGFHVGTDWRFFRPVAHGERVALRTWMDAVEEKPSTMAGKKLAVYFSTVFHNGANEVLAHARSVTYRMERGASRDRNKLGSKFEPAVWTRAQLDEVEAAYERERPRGANPRYWDDVEVGERLEPVTKGPLCMSDMIAFYAGAMVAPTPAHGLAIKDYRRHPNWWFRNPENGGLEPIIRVHENIQAAQAAGVPAPYDVGVQRHSWLIQLITNWMGDDAFLVRNDGSYTAFNYFGDLTTFSGEVVRKFEEDGQHLVELTVRGTNQRGVVSIPGTAIVALPARGDAEMPVVRYSRQRVALDDYLRTLPNAPLTAATVV